MPILPEVPAACALVNHRYQRRAAVPGPAGYRLLEPAYDIAGDAFDCAVNGPDLHFAIVDGIGHGIGSTLLTGLAVGAYRHARRDGAPVADIHAAIDAALAGYYDDLSADT
jgi:Stage II sporulation protein E (SpoIIE)